MIGWKSLLLMTLLTVTQAVPAFAGGESDSGTKYVADLQAEVQALLARNDDAIIRQEAITCILSRPKLPLGFIGQFLMKHCPEAPPSTKCLQELCQALSNAVIMESECTSKDPYEKCMCQYAKDKARANLKGMIGENSCEQQYRMKLTEQSLKASQLGAEVAELALKQMDLEEKCNALSGTEYRDCMSSDEMRSVSTALQQKTAKAKAALKVAKATEKQLGDCKTQAWAEYNQLVKDSGRCGTPPEK